MGVRRAHLVGSIPAASAAEAMRLAVSRLGPDLGYLPDGETGVRRNWVIGMIEGFRSHPDLRLVKDGDWSDYDKTPRFALQSGHRLYGAALDLGITAAARAAMSEFDTQRAMLADGSHPGPGFLVGIPGDLDLALFTFGPSGPVRHVRPFTEALASTMYQIRRMFGDDVLFQIEVPVESVLVARTPSALRPALAALMARRISALAQGAPEGSRFGLHLCLGDMDPPRAPTGPRPAWTSQRAPGHDHLRAGIYFRTQAPVLPVRPSAVARRCPGQLEALHLRAAAREGAERGRGMGHVWVTCRACHDQLRQTTFYEPPHDITRSKAGA